MAIALKYNTASQEVPLGYFLDSTDGDTEETALTIANTDVKLWKAGATTLANKNSGGGTHISNGIYYVVLDATDTNTYGPLIIFVHVSGALPVRVECEVINALVWDSLYGTDKQEVDLVQIGGATQSATDLKDFADAGYDPASNKVQGVVLADTVTTLTGHTAQTGDSFARLGAPAGASIAADLLVIDNFVDELESRLTAIRAGYLDNLNGHTAQTGDNFAITNHASYGNAQLVRSTTPANTLDVAATGEAGLDFDNIKDASIAHTLTNIRVPNVTLTDTTTTNTDMVAAAPTAVQNRQEMDSNSTELAKIGAIPALDGAGQTIGEAIAKLADDNGGANFDATTDSLERLANTAPLGTTMRGTDNAAAAASLATHDGKLDTAQADLDILTGADGVTLATLQGNYAPAKAGDSMGLANDAITSAKYDETTAFPLKSADAAATQVARVGADGDTLETLSDQIDLQALASVVTEARLAELDAANIPADIDTLKTGVNTTSISGSTAAADNLEASAGTIVTGVVEDHANNSTTQMQTDLAEATDDHYNGRIIIYTSGALKWQASDITDYVGASGTLVYTAMTEEAVAGDTFVIV